MKQLKKEYDNIEIPPQLLNNIEASISSAKRSKRRARHLQRTIASIAAVLALIAILPNTTKEIAATLYDTPLGPIFRLVTVRSYKEDTPNHQIDVEIPTLTLADVSNGMSSSSLANAKLSIKKINENIQSETLKYEQYLKEDVTHDENTVLDLLVTSNVTTDDANVFSLKLSIYEASASGNQIVRYYNIDKKTGKLITLEDIFGKDYISIISSNIKAQMIEKMSTNTNIIYFISNTENQTQGFDKIAKEQPFYIDGKNNVIISFDESTVAPSYMGIQEFIIGTYTN